MKKIFISADMEGTAGIVNWDETDIGKHLYDHFALQMTKEVAAACEGALAGGADSVVVKDAHDSARNINPDLLPERAEIIRAWAKQLQVMMAGLDESFYGAFMTGYHSAAEMTTNPLSHTMNLSNNYVKMNGLYCPEMMINSMMASYLRVPVLLLTGDKGLCDYMRQFVPDCVTVPVSEGMGAASRSIQPALAVRRIREGAEAAMKLDPRKCLFPMPKDFEIEVSFKQHFDALNASNYRDCEQIGPRTVRYRTDDFVEVMRFFYWIL